MNNYSKSLAMMGAATFVGLTIVIIVALITHFGLATIVAIFFPSAPLPPNQGLSVIRLPSNFGIYLTILTFLVLLNGCVGSFIAQYLFRRWGRQANSQAWQSFLIGVIIGFFSANLQEILRNRPITIIVPLIYGVSAALIGLLGYYIAGRKYRRRVSQ